MLPARRIWFGYSIKLFICKIHPVKASLWAHARTICTSNPRIRRHVSLNHKNRKLCRTSHIDIKPKWTLQRPCQSLSF
jgi:hypothetical protein